MSQSQPHVWNDSLVGSVFCQASLSLCWKAWNVPPPLWEDKPWCQAWLLGKGTGHTNSSHKTGQGNSAVTATTRGCWEEKGLRAMVGLSLPLWAWRTPREKPVQRAGDSHGQSKNFPTIKHTELHGAAKRTLVHQGDEGGRERGGWSDSYNNTVQRSPSYGVSLAKGPLTVNTFCRPTLFCEGYSVDHARTQHSSRHV